MQIVVSAPGKIHLLGEHAAVYGYPALLASLDKRLYVEVRSVKRRAKSEKIIIKTAEKKDLVLETIAVFKRHFKVAKLPPLEIIITSQIPTGSGLGSSAALSGALIGALMKFVKNIWNPGKINELSYMVEKIAHGNPSGADNTTVVFGGLIWYRREFEFLKSIWSLPLSSYKIPRFYITDSGRPKESTITMVESVGRLYKKNTGKVMEIFNNQEKQTKRLLLALKYGDKKELMDTIKCGQANLEKIEVVGDRAMNIVRSIEGIGGAAKVCGGGGIQDGSGIILSYHPNPNKFRALGKRIHVDFSQVVLGEEGVRIEL